MKLSYTHIKDSILSVKKDKRKDIFLWGQDNLFPQLIEGLINQSVTSKNCVDKVAKAIYGKSFGEDGRIIVNKDGQSLNELLRIASYEYSKYNNIFIHVGYDGNLDIKSLKVIPSTNCRIGKDDDKGYSGKVVVYDNWDRSKGRVESNKFKSYDRYNPIREVIEAQIAKAGNIMKYKGQILHIQKDSNVVYSLPDLNPVMQEALLENNSQTFRSRGADKGFLNTKLMVVQPFASDAERQEFRGTLDDLQGAENAGNVLLLESSYQSEDLGSQVRLEDLSSDYNDKLFQYSDQQAEKNISKAYGVPMVLIDTTNDGLFGNSGEMLREAKRQLWEAREEERLVIEETINILMSKWNGDNSSDRYEIISPIADESSEGEVETQEVDG